jgi:hypothetical protein
MEEHTKIEYGESKGHFAVLCPLRDVTLEKEDIPRNA